LNTQGISDFSNSTQNNNHNHNNSFHNHFNNYNTYDNHSHNVSEILKRFSRISLDSLHRTSTTTPTTTSTQSTTTTSSTTTTKKPARRRREATTPEFEWNVKALVESGSIKPENIAFENMMDFTTTEIPMTKRVEQLLFGEAPYFGVCTNSTKILEDPKKIYGYYKRTIMVENPVMNVTVGNNNWLKHGDLCKLDVKFTGTGPFKVCYNVRASDNTSDLVEDDVDCRGIWEDVEVKEYSYSRFFPRHSNSYTLSLFIKNEVSMVKTPIGVNFYEGKSNFPP
jgi:hypothetical protein